MLTGAHIGQMAGNPVVAVTSRRAWRPHRAGGL